MNVLDVFSRGDGKLNEPHLTSALAFLLDPTESHGLKTAFIREILEPISSQINERLSSRKLSLESLFSPYWAIEVETEERFKSIETTSHAQQSRDIDIVIRFCSSTGSCALMVAIENKIKKESSSDKAQLVDEVRYLLDRSGEESLIVFIYLTPRRLMEGLSDDLWRNLTLFLKDRKETNLVAKSYCWGPSRTEVNGISTEANSISIASIRDIICLLLKKELDAVIDPASSHTSLLLRSLLRFIDERIAVTRRSAAKDVDYSMEVNDDPEAFWTHDWGPKEAAKRHARQIKDLLEQVVKRTVQSVEPEYQVVSRSTTSRYGVYLAQSTDVDLLKKIIPGRVFRIRSDGKTNRAQVEIIFSIAETTAEEDKALENPPADVSFIREHSSFRVFSRVREHISEHAQKYLEQLAVNFSVPCAIVELKKP